MNATEVRVGERSALSERLATSRTVRVRLEQLLTWWAEACPRLVGDPRSAQGLSDTLDELAAAGSIELPKGSWDRSTTPALPSFVTVPAAKRAQRGTPWLTFPWRAELGWVSSLPSLTDSRFVELVAVNDWLSATAGTTPVVVPRRYRSAELFGDEKALDRLAATPLFGPGRLSYELLRCVRFPAPLPAARVGDGSDVLVVENSDPYWAAVDALLEIDGHRVGAVVWGSGKAFPSQVESLGVDVAGRGPVTGDVWYWGDFDPAGVAIAEAAAAAAAICDAPLIRVPRLLWAAYTDVATSEPGLHQWPEQSPWLDADLWDALAVHRDRGGRVAQEATQPDTITDWAETFA